MADLPNIEKNRVVVEGPAGTDQAVESDGSARKVLYDGAGTKLLGQKTMAGSVPVAIASDQSMLPVRTWGPSSAKTRINTNTTTTVKSGAGFLRRIIKSKGGTVTIYDNTAGSGTVIHTLDGTNPQGTIVYDVPFTTGLTIVTASGPDILVVYD